MCLFTHGRPVSYTRQDAECLQWLKIDCDYLIFIKELKKQVNRMIKKVGGTSKKDGETTGKGGLWWWRRSF